jgi:putative transposase
MTSGKPRRPLRLPGYDYSQTGAYFLTICAKGRVPLFGSIVNGKMELNRNGIIVEQSWNELAVHYFQVALAVFVVMPNHVHGILVLLRGEDQPVGAGLKPAPTKEIAA